MKIEKIKVNEANKLTERIKNKDRKIRYKALEEIYKLSKSNKSKQKAELLKILHEKTSSPDWEERYISMYGLSRFMWRSGKFRDFQRAYQDVLKLLEDEDGRVRISAFNALEQFRACFIACVYIGIKQFNKKDLVKLWLDSLILLWDKTKNLKEEKKQHFMMKCIGTLFRPDMECYLNNKEGRVYLEIWEKLQQSNEKYNERAY